MRDTDDEERHLGTNKAYFVEKSRSIYEGVSTTISLLSVDVFHPYSLHLNDHACVILFWNRFPLLPISSPSIHLIPTCQIQSRMRRKVIKWGQVILVIDFIYLV